MSQDAFLEDRGSAITGPRVGASRAASNKLGLGASSRRRTPLCSRPHFPSQRIVHFSPISLVDRLLSHGSSYTSKRKDSSLSLLDGHFDYTWVASIQY